MPNSLILVVDDDPAMRDSLRTLLDAAGHKVRDFGEAAALLADPALGEAGCVVSDVHMPGMSGVELLEELGRRKIGVPVIIITGQGDVPLAVRAMKAGAIDFVEKPFDDEVLLAGIARALDVSHETRERASDAKTAQDAIARLTEREREVLQHLIAGQSNKLVAHALGISPRTVEIHRARLMEKLRARNLSDLVRLALASGMTIAGEAPKR